MRMDWNWDASVIGASTARYRVATPGPSTRASTWRSTGTPGLLKGALEIAVGRGVPTPVEVVVPGGVVTGAVVEEVALGVVVAVGDGVTSSAKACEGPKEARARANETTSAVETAGYATTARTRTRRTMSLFLHFTGNSLE
jgi:hypothetical protein